MQERMNGLESENAGLKTKLAEVAGQAIEEKKENSLKVPDAPFEHEGQKYKVQVAGFHFPGENGALISAEELMADPALIKKVLEIEGQGILKQLV
jgi:hypothetical protein